MTALAPDYACYRVWWRYDVDDSLDTERAWLVDAVTASDAEHQTHDKFGDEGSIEIIRVENLDSN